MRIHKHCLTRHVAALCALRLPFYKELKPHFKLCLHVLAVR